MQSRAAERGVCLVADCADLPAAFVDPEGIHRALLNLVTNAIDAVVEADQPRVIIQLTGDAAGLTIIVLDNGSGIPADVLPKLFKPFESTKGSRHR